jgi:hypothetical protein
MRVQLSHPYKAKGRSMVLFILVFMFLAGRWEYEGF